MIKREGGEKRAERESSLRLVWLNARERVSEREKVWQIHKYRWIDR